MLNKPIKRSLVFGLACAVIGTGFGIFVSLGFTHPSYNFFWIPVALSSFAFGTLLWFLLPERQARRRVLWGAIAGVLGSLVAHFATWLLVGLGIYSCNWLDCSSSVGKPPANLWEVLETAAVASLFSILIIGWITTLVGAILGGVYAFVLQKRNLME